jgi:hypothetical protein
MFRLADSVLVQETCINTSGPLVEKHSVVLLLQINRISDLGGGCTVHFGICRVHSPTNALFFILKYTLKFTLKYT